MKTSILSPAGKAMLAVAPLLFAAKSVGEEPRPSHVSAQPGISLNSFSAKDPAGESDYWHGLEYAREGNWAEAVKWIRKAAEQGHAQAQLCLGDCYSRGNGVEQDYTEAVKWIRMAAEQNYAQAQLYLGVCYFHGYGVEQDYAEAVKWFRMAAEQNYAQAQLYLGVCYFHGYGVEQDYAEAVKWFRMAAEHGNADARKAIKSLDR